MARKYPIARRLPEWLVEAFLRAKKPMLVSEITGVRSETGKEIDGVFVGCPLTPKMMLQPGRLEQVYDKIVQTVELAATHGAQIVGLGAFTSVVGDGGVTIAKRSPVPITTGNSYTVATAIEGTLDACQRLGIEPGASTLAVVGATGAIGRTCAVVLAPEFAQTVVLGRDPARTQALAGELPRSRASTDPLDLRRADAIITVTSAEGAIIQPEHLKPGCVVCDVARPRDVSRRVQAERPDVLVIEGGVVAVPGEAADFHFNFGFPPKTAYACMSETMMLALEERLENYTLGRDVRPDQVQETREWARKHGFRLAGYRSFERAVDEALIERVRSARPAQAAV